MAKRKHKVMTEPQVFDGDAPPAEPATPSVSPVITTASDPSPQLGDQVKSMLDSFKDSLGARFASIDHRFSQFSASSASPVSISNVTCQDAINHSFTAPSPVAVRSEHPPDRGPYALYADGLGSSLGGPATLSASVDATSLPRMAFADLLTTVQLLESRGRVPDAFIDSLRSYVVVASDFDIAIGSALLVDFIRTLRYPDPLHPLPGPSREVTVLSLFFTVSWRLRGRLQHSSQRALAPCFVGGVL